MRNTASEELDQLVQTKKPWGWDKTSCAIRKEPPINPL